MTNLIRNRWLPFKEARDYVRNTDIDTEMKWKYQRKNLPKFIPREPHILYKEEWSGFPDWLGTNNIRGRLRKYKVNDDFFKKWSSDMAYILGFWWADGHIRRRGNRFFFGICQHKNSYQHMQNVLDKMDSDYPICCPKTRIGQCSFEISSKSIFQDIVKLGGAENKSLTLRMPKVPDKYFPDFLRGLFDGDGCVYCYKKKQQYTSYICSGSIKLLEDLELIMQKYGFKAAIRSNGNAISPCMKLNFGIVYTRKLGEFMYNVKSDLKLDRKYQMFKKAGAKV